MGSSELSQPVRAPAKHPEWSGERVDGSSGATAEEASDGPLDQADRATPGATAEEAPAVQSRPRVPPGLQHLFGVEGGEAGGAEGDDGWSSGSADSPTGLSPYLRAYEAARTGGVLPLGLQPLDDVLGGGIDRGVMAVAGDPGAGKTLLLEEAARSAIARGWWVYYAAYREGTLCAWERLMARASLQDQGLALPLSALRGRTLDAASLERLHALDARFRQQTASRLVLVERLPGGRDGLRALLDNIWWRVREAREAGGRGPVVLIDDLQTLERLTAEQPGGRRTPGTVGVALTDLGGVSGTAALVSRLDRELVRLGVPGLVSVAPAAPGDPGREQAPVLDEPGLLASFFLRLTGGYADGGTEVPLEVSLEKNGRTGWVGRFHASLDRRTGSFGS